MSGSFSLTANVGLDQLTWKLVKRLMNYRNLGRIQSLGLSQKKGNDPKISPQNLQINIRYQFWCSNWRFSVEYPLTIKQTSEQRAKTSHCPTKGTQVQLIGGYVTQCHWFLTLVSYVLNSTFGQFTSYPSLGFVLSQLQS